MRRLWFALAALGCVATTSWGQSPYAPLAEYATAARKPRPQAPVQPQQQVQVKPQAVLAPLQTIRAAGAADEIMWTSSKEPQLKPATPAPTLPMPSSAGGGDKPSTTTLPSMPSTPITSAPSAPVTMPSTTLSPSHAAPALSSAAPMATTIQGSGGCGTPGGCGSPAVVGTTSGCGSPAGCASQASPCAPACGPVSPCPCGPCGPSGAMWLSAEYLLTWVSGQNVPALVTGSPNGTPIGQVGVLGAPGTNVLFGGNQVDEGYRTGFRVRGGFWLDQCRRIGIDGGFFWLAPQDTSYAAASNGVQVGRPFFNLGLNRQDAQLVPGSVAVNTKTELLGGDAALRYNLACSPSNPCGCQKGGSRIDLITGWRILHLTDEVNVNENLRLAQTTNGIPAGTRILVNDRFRTENTFNGSTVGLVGEWWGDRFSMTARGTVALGITHSVAEVAGGTVITTPGAQAQSYSGGLLAQGTNIGRYTQDNFAVVPEVGLTLGFRATEHVRLTAGYNFLYWSNVARAGDQIDPVINTSQIPPGTLNGMPRPLFNWNNSDLVLHGLNLGAELRY